MEGIAADKLPRHVAIIMDGNGRWAEKRNLSRIQGHRRGIEAVREIITFSRNLGIKYLTLYTFSKENWGRPASEVKMLMSFLESHIRSEAPMFMENGIRLRVIGNLAELPASVIKAIDDVEKMTARNSEMTLSLAVSYGARDEITDAVRKIASMVKDGSIDVGDINEEVVGGAMYTSGMPDPDLLIRTSGERRVSNFLLWQIAYAELYVTDVMWPDFTKEDFLAAIRDYQRRERRFGLTRSQIAAG